MSRNLPAEVLDIARRLRRGAYLRTVNYHNTAARHADVYDRQLAYVAQHYQPVGIARLDDYFAGRGWGGEKPPILLGFFDGYRNNYQTALPLLEKHGLHAWFLLVTDFIGAADDRQEAAVADYFMEWEPGGAVDGRYAMTWAEAARVAENHTVVNHSATHCKMTREGGVEALAHQVDDAQAAIEAHCKVSPRAFSWLYGGWYTWQPQVNDYLQRRGYDYLLGYRLERICGHPGTDAPLAAGPGEADFTPRPGDTAQAAAWLRAHEARMARHTLNDGVPAILPLFCWDVPLPQTTRAEDARLAAQYCAVANLLLDGGAEAEGAVYRALEVLAGNTIGEGFPHR